MEFSELLLSRRSCRRYRVCAPVSRETLSAVLADTVLAPSWKNTETARYYAALSADAADAVRAALPDFNVDSTQNAAAYVVTTFVRGVSGKIGDASNDKWGAYDCGLQAAYFVLSARAHGLDSLIMGLYDEKALRTLFAIPENEEVMSVIALGQAADVPALRPRKTPAEVSKVK